MVYTTREVLIAKKETFVQPLDYIVTPSGLTDGAKEAYKFITEADRTAPDFVEKRASLAESIGELATYMRWCKVVAESIQAGLFFFFLGLRLQARGGGLVPTGYGWGMHREATGVHIHYTEF